MLKTINLEGIGEVILARRRGTRSLRLSVNGGNIRLGIPLAISEQQAVNFILSKKDWILKHHKTAVLLSNGARIGKAHRLAFEPTSGQKITTKLIDNKALVRLPTSIQTTDSEAQTAAKRVCRKALELEANSLLPQRLKAFADKTNASYKTVKIRFLKSRWGSCSPHNDIVLSAYLIQLPWELIDYVIIHELAHTKNHNHGQNFWNEVTKLVPDYKAKRKLLKTYQTDVTEIV
ncbi:MAG: SprT family zinc-dependent metalloprotease [Candidatus Saccharibacteria bacterium]|nr:SprT family zinc-dependent metalloprotease [Candidatus Saccharibacteria bacterium]